MWRSVDMDKGLRIALSSGFFARDSALGAAARVLCRSWKAAVGLTVAPRSSRPDEWQTPVDLEDLPGWCASFPQAVDVHCAAGAHGSADAVAPAAAALAGLPRLRTMRVRCKPTDAAVLSLVPATVTHLCLDCWVNNAMPPPAPLSEELLRLPALQFLTLEGVLADAPITGAMPRTLVGLQAYTGLAADASFSHLPLLRKLCIQRQSHEAAAALATGTPHLQALEMVNPDPMAELRADLLRRFTTLRRLRWHGSMSSEALAGLPSTLEELELRPWDVSEASKPSLAHLNRLRCLTFTAGPDDGTPPTHADDFVGTFPPTLRQLDMGPFELTRDVAFSHLPALEEVSLQYTSVSDNSVASLPRTVTKLDLRGCTELTPACSFAHLSRLQWLYVHAAVLTAGGAAAASLSTHARAAIGGAGSVWPLRTLGVSSESSLDSGPPAFEHLTTVTMIQAEFGDLSDWDLSPLVLLHTLEVQFCSGAAGMLPTAPPSLRKLTASARGVTAWPHSLLDLTVYHVHSEALQHLPPTLRTLLLVSEESFTIRGQIDWSTTQLERLSLRDISGGRHLRLGRGFFAMLPRTLRVLVCSSVSVLPPSADAEGGGAGGAAAPQRLDLSHLPALQHCRIDLSESHPPVTVAAMGRQWVV
jgi:hypothetical protein